MDIFNPLIFYRDDNITNLSSNNTKKTKFSQLNLDYEHIYSIDKNQSIVIWGLSGQGPASQAQPSPSVCEARARAGSAKAGPCPCFANGGGQNTYIATLYEVFCPPLAASPPAKQPLLLRMQGEGGAASPLPLVAASHARGGRGGKGWVC